MIDPNSYGNEENMVAPGGGPEQPMASGGYPSQYRFSPDELEVLRECNRESFVQRSMPLSTMAGLTTYIAIQKGHLRGNARFGPFPKVTLAVMAGYFIGKLSYQQACAEKLMALPGSYIGQLLRERRDGKVSGAPFQQRQGTTMFGAKASDIYSDAGPGSSLDLDTDRPVFSEDNYRPGSHDETPATPETKPRTSVSYDDLRRKNRGEYNDSKQDPYRTDPGPIMRSQPPPPTPPQPRPNTNKYGDVME